MTRLGILLTATVSILACAALGAPALGAAVAHGAGREHGLSHSASAHMRSNAQSRAKARAERRRNAAAHRVPTRKTRVKRPAATRTRKNATALREAIPSKAVTIAKVLATPCQNAQLIPEPGNLQLISAAVLCLVNTQRAEHGESPLQANAQLEQAAASHGQEMISLDYFDHVSPNGLTPVGRIRSTGYIPSSEVGYVIGENLAWGTLGLATPQAIVSAWIASPGHLANILESKYRDTGIGVVPEVPAALVERAPGALYTQEFGVIVR